MWSFLLKKLRGCHIYFLATTSRLTCVPARAKAAPFVAGLVHVSMLYMNITFIFNTTELFTTVNDPYEQQLTTDKKTIDT